MKLSRKQFISILGGLGSLPFIGFAYMKLFEADWYEVTHKTITIDRFDSPLRILHLSDFHASESVSLESIETAIDLALEQKADVAFLTGDFITKDLDDAEGYSRILSKLSEKIPTYACIGNHDGGSWAASTYGQKDFKNVQQMLESSGVTFLFNQSIRIRTEKHSFTVAGLGDLWSDDCKPDRVLHTTRADNEAVFVLSHNPDSKDLLKPFDWDLMCCGHTHGGQLVIPFLGSRPFLPVRDKSFPEGLLSWGSRHIHITRGIGNLHGMRFNCRPEISVLTVS
ncbi:MAG: phosphodiesterase YaeI [Opitutaceae bacterium]